ncbi:acyl-CoA thioesterase [Bradyrhizobium forestalis]|uniref:acyl-CoA thioesterase n=1 Tax=Bradyrhizobium forestalis TaxID=1419263 RepID=UPI001FDF6C29|nr:acyl-CoA thioesterase domain-containing protein [Bradyrhizobium forestalis]
MPIIYRVEHLRSGNSGSCCSITAIQCGDPVLSILIPFHAEEQGMFNHQDKVPDVPLPQELTAEECSRQSIFPEAPEFIRRYFAIDLRPAEIGRYVGQKIDHGRIHIWIKMAGKLPIARQSGWEAALPRLNCYRMLSGCLT